MPRKSVYSSRKRVTLGVRLVPRIKDLVFQVANSEGMDASEWLRNLIVDELKKRGALPTVSTEADFMEGEALDE